MLVLATRRHSAKRRTWPTMRWTEPSPTNADTAWTTGTTGSTSPTMRAQALSPSASRRCPAGPRCRARRPGPRAPQGSLNRAARSGHHLYPAAGGRQACAVAGQALDLPADQRIGPITQRAQDLLGELEPWRGRPAVEELRERGESIYREPLTHAGFLLSATSRMVIATGIANIWARDLFTMTAAQLTLSKAYPERCLLGLGVSHARLVQGIRGHYYQQPFAAMRRYLDRMDEAARAYRAVKPAVMPPHVLAALGPRMLTLAAHRGAGCSPLARHARPHSEGSQCSRF
jgi:hypothetical protein